MKLSKFDYIIIYTLGILLTFTVSFNIALGFYGKKNKVYNAGVVNSEKLVSTSAVEKFLSEDTLVLLQLKNNDTIINTKTIPVKELKGNMSKELTLTNVKEYFHKKGYEFVSDSNFEVVFIKETKFLPQRYYLGVTRDDFIAIFKCDNEGNLFIEDPINDISNRDIETMPEKDREYLQNYEYQYKTKEEAADELMALIS